MLNEWKIERLIRLNVGIVFSDDYHRIYHLCDSCWTFRPCRIRVVVLSYQQTSLLFDSRSCGDYYFHSWIDFKYYILKTIIKLYLVIRLGYYYGVTNKSKNERVYVFLKNFFSSSIAQNRRNLNEKSFTFHCLVFG